VALHHDGTAPRPIFVHKMDNPCLETSGGTAPGQRVYQGVGRVDGGGSFHEVRNMDGKKKYEGKKLKVGRWEGAEKS